VYRHHQSERRTERDGERSGEKEREVQGDDSEKRARAHPDQGPEVVCLLAAQVDAGEVPSAELVGDPGLQGTAAEHVAHVPDQLREQDRGEDRHRPLEREACSDQEETHDDRAAAAVGVGKHAGWHFEDEERPAPAPCSRAGSDRRSVCGRPTRWSRRAEEKPEGAADEEVDGVGSQAVHPDVAT
jgi:hypothetical protein